MIKCSKCGGEPNEHDMIGWKCNSCGKVFRVTKKQLDNIWMKKDAAPEKSLMKCPACKGSLDDGNEKIAWKCSCGNIARGCLKDFKKEMAILPKSDFMKDMEDGDDMSDQENQRSYSEYEILKEKEQIGIEEEKKDTAIYKKRKCISIIMCLIGCVLFIAAATRITNDKYEFYKQHYQECIIGYNDAKAMADSYRSGIFKSTYNSIASAYEDMIEEDHKEIWKFRMQAIVLLCGGFVLLIGGCHTYKGTKKISRYVERSECDKENISNTAMSGSEYRQDLNVYYENKKVAASQKKIGKIILWIVVAGLIILGIYYFATRCSYEGCNEKKIASSKYCYYHTMVMSYSSSGSYSSAPKTGNEGALEKARSYLNSSAFSYTGLMGQLEYSGFSESEAKYGVDYCGANWKEQALKKAKSYLASSSFSYSGLLDQLEYEGFSEEEAKYGVDYCGADWKEQAVKKAKSYLRSSDFTRSGLIDQLEYEGFTYEQAVYGVDQSGL